MHRDIIALGASAGGVEALRALVAGLPPDLDASIFVVLHVPAHTPSKLTEVLGAAGPLAVVTAEDGTRIERNRIYVAPPDLHMIVEADRILVRRGPRENRFRPSIDALFRSVAYVYGARSIGVVLSGALDDGTSGLWSIKRLGGVSVVQDPRDALHSEMPQSACKHVEIDHLASAADLGPLLGWLVKEVVVGAGQITSEHLARLALEVDISVHEGGFHEGIMSWGPLARFTCPECSSALVQLQEGDHVRFRCRSGHAYTPSGLLAGLTEAVETALRAAVRALEEQAVVLEHLAVHFESAGPVENAQQLTEKAREARERAHGLRTALLEHK